jgi:hypothetical protein
MEGEGGADSGAPPASPPLPPLTYEHLAFFEDKRCILPEHERALKQHLYNRTFGIAHLRGFASRAPIFQMLQDSRHEGPKRTIWRYLDVPKPVELEVEIVIPATSMYSSIATADNMLAGRKVWFTNSVPAKPAHQAESVVLGVAAGSRVTSFDVASVDSQSERQMCVEEVAADGTVGATLVAWDNYGTQSGTTTTRATTRPPRSRYRRHMLRRRTSKSPSVTPTPLPTSSPVHGSPDSRSSA